MSPDPSSAPSAQLKLKNAPTLTLFAKSKVRKRTAAANNDPNAAVYKTNYERAHTKLKETTKKQ